MRTRVFSTPSHQTVELIFKLLVSPNLTVEEAYISHSTKQELERVKIELYDSL